MNFLKVIRTDYLQSWHCQTASNRAIFGGPTLNFRHDDSPKLQIIRLQGPQYLSVQNNLAMTDRKNVINLNRG